MGASTRDHVRRILADHPGAREDDRTLLYLYWKLIDRVTNLEGIQYATSPGTIKRARQYFNERGIYLASNPEVLKHRNQFQK